ncbi:MAG: SAF domain-containing protein [Ilumatobacter sp.]
MTDTFERVDPTVGTVRDISKARRPSSQVSRRQGMLFALGLLLVVGGGLASLALVRAGDQRVEVLVMARDLPAGQQIAPDDLTVAEVASDDLAMLPATQRALVVGSYARVRLLAGQPIAPSLVQSEPLITDGTVVIAIPVSSIDLPAGTREQSVVDLVVTDRATSGGAVDAEAFIARAVVVEFPAFADTGRDTAALSVEVDPLDAPTLVASLDDIAIVLVDPAFDPAPADNEVDE